MSSFDAAARRLHPDSYKQEATSAAPAVEKKKKPKKRKAEPLPAVGDVVAARGLRKGDDAEARGTVTKIKRAKRDDKKSKRSSKSKNDKPADKPAPEPEPAAAAGDSGIGGGFGGAIVEDRDENVHSSMQKIQVVNLRE